MGGWFRKKALLELKSEENLYAQKIYFWCKKWRKRNENYQFFFRKYTCRQSLVWTTLDYHENNNTVTYHICVFCWDLAIEIARSESGTSMVHLVFTFPLPSHVLTSRIMIHAGWFQWLVIKVYVFFLEIKQYWKVYGFNCRFVKIRWWVGGSEPILTLFELRNPYGKINRP